MAHQADSHSNYRQNPVLPSVVTAAHWVTAPCHHIRAGGGQRQRDGDHQGTGNRAAEQLTQESEAKPCQKDINHAPGNDRAQERVIPILRGDCHQRRDHHKRRPQKDRKPGPHRSQALGLDKSGDAPCKDGTLEQECDLLWSPTQIVRGKHRHQHNGTNEDNHKLHGVEKASAHRRGFLQLINQPAPLVYCLPFTLHGRPSYFYRGPKPGGFRRFVRGQECNSFDTRGRGL